MYKQHFRYSLQTPQFKCLRCVSATGRKHGIHILVKQQETTHTQIKHPFYSNSHNGLIKVCYKIKVDMENSSTPNHLNIYIEIGF